jgi:hypothetical protein
LPFKNAEEAKQYYKQYYKDHRQKALEYVKKRNLSFPEIRKEYRAKHRLENAEYTRAYRKKSPNFTWRDKYRKQAVEASRQWATTHIEQRKANQSKAKALHRMLGFTPLNHPFDDCEAHHLDHDRVVYIPKALHKSVSHNGRTGRNMEQMNRLALEWLTSCFL